MNPQLECEGDRCKCEGDCSNHRMGNEGLLSFRRSCTVMNLGPEGNQTSHTVKEEKFNSVEMDYDEEMQYIYGDLEPLEEIKYLVLNDWESKPHDSMMVEPKLEAEEESTWWPHPHSSGVVEKSFHNEAKSASRAPLQSTTAGEAVMRMQPETDLAVPEENCSPKIGSDRLRTKPCGDNIEVSEPTLAETEPQLKHKVGVPVVDSDFVVPDFVSKTHNRTSVEQKFQESALRFWSHNSSAVEQKVQAGAESASRLLPDLNLVVEESTQENCEPKSWQGRLRIQPHYDDFKVFERTVAQTEPQWKPNDGSHILHDDLTLTKSDSKSHNSMTLEQRLHSAAEFGLRPQTQHSMLVEQNVQAEAESTLRLLPDLNLVVEESAPEENFDPKSWQGRLRIQPCDDDSVAFEPKLTQTEPQWKPNDGGHILDDDLTLTKSDLKSHNSMTLEPRLHTAAEFGLRPQTKHSMLIEQNVQAEAESTSRLLPDLNLVAEKSAPEEKFDSKSWLGGLRIQPCDDDLEAFEPTLTQTEPQGTNSVLKSHNSMTLEPKLHTATEFGLWLRTQHGMIIKQNVQAESESASRILIESNTVTESAMLMQVEGDGTAREENYGPKNGHGRLRTVQCGALIKSSEPTSAQAEARLKRKAVCPIIENDQHTPLPEDSAVSRKTKQRIDNVGHLDEEQQ